MNVELAVERDRKIEIKIKTSGGHHMHIYYVLQLYLIQNQRSDTGDRRHIMHVNHYEKLDKNASFNQPYHTTGHRTNASLTNIAVTFEREKVRAEEKKKPIWKTVFRIKRSTHDPCGL